VWPLPVRYALQEYKGNYPFQALDEGRGRGFACNLGPARILTSLQRTEDSF
jgi:hypothetical protein